MTTIATPPELPGMPAPPPSVEFEGKTISKLEVSFSGSFETSLYSEKDQRILDDIKLGTPCTVELNVRGRKILLDARIAERGFAQKKQKGGGTVGVTKAKVKVDDELPEWSES